MRPEILYPFFSDLTSLKGVGPTLARKLGTLTGGDTLIDLLLHLPVRWVDRRLRTSISPDLVGHTATVKGTIHSVHISKPRARQPARISIIDTTNTLLDIVYFHAAPRWLEKRFVVGEQILVSGLIEEFRSVLQIVHPDYLADQSTEHSIPHVEPVYRKMSGISDTTLHKVIRQALDLVPDLDEWLPQHLCQHRIWPRFRDALVILHTPKTPDADTLARARARLAFDEILVRQILIAKARTARACAHATPLADHDQRTHIVLDSLPFTPTDAQMRAIEDVKTDLAQNRPMRRILQGDVGSGKTLVAAMAIAQAAEANTRSAVMCPTEILARQHTATFNTLLAPLNRVCQTLTAAQTPKNRNSILAAFAHGHIHALSGTQALIQKSLNLPDLNLIVIDEHHRFGISERTRLLAKATSPHLLMMTATPIPRTLALMLDGDADTSILDQMPQERIPIRTSAVPDTRISEVTNALVAAVQRGEQAYWICPALDSDRDDANVLKRHQALCEIVTPPPALIHGRMTASDKDAVVESFRSGKIRVLVATTVVEVGLDIPDARIMIIENAHRFGLAQLHQLRGRVGRGQKASTCLLLYQPPLSPEARKRIEALRATTNGFEIAQLDLDLRGAGDILGLNQSGLPRLRVFDPARDTELIEPARHTATLLSESGISESVQLATELLRPQRA